VTNPPTVGAHYLAVVALENLLLDLVGDAEDFALAAPAA
jgi:hypothetical protein